MSRRTTGGGLRYPKQKTRAKRQSHAKRSILQKPADRKRCWLCMSRNHDYSEKQVLHKHHAFGGPLRSMSEEQGFFVWLCPYHHVMGRDAVHNNPAVNRILQQQIQRMYEASHTRREFMQLAGRSYL